MIHGRPHSPFIHTLDDYSLLNIFSLTRPTLLDEGEASILQILGGGQWNRERWWYGLVQVCRRWRYIMLESASYLRLAFICVRGTPVADMLAYSPPLPLIIDHYDEHRDLTAKDEEGILLALQNRHRLRRIRLVNPIPILQRLVNALDGEFPILEYLLIMHRRYQIPTIEHNINFKLPESFRAPNLRHLLLENFVLLIGSPLLTTMGNLVTLSLNQIPPSASFHPNSLLQWLSLLPQLEILGISFNSHFPSRNIENQLLRTPIVTRVTLPNLHWLGFQGASAYLEALLPWVTIPLLERFQVYFFHQMTYSLPQLEQFMSTAKNLLLKRATVTFHEDYVNLKAYPDMETRMFTLSVDLGGGHLNWQVAAGVNISHALRAVFSAAEHLTLEYGRHFRSAEWVEEADRTQWRELFGSLDKVKTLHVDYRLVKQVSCALQPDEGESPAELFPELQELSYSAISTLDSAFAVFVYARQKAGRPVTVIQF
jgi:hypothetical protein